MKTIEEKIDFTHYIEEQLDLIKEANDEYYLNHVKKEDLLYLYNQISEFRKNVGEFLREF